MPDDLRDRDPSDLLNIAGWLSLVAGLVAGMYVWTTIDPDAPSWTLIGQGFGLLIRGVLGFALLRGLAVVVLELAEIRAAVREWSGPAVRGRE